MPATPSISLYSTALLAALAILAGCLQIRLRGLATRLSLRFFVVLFSVALLSWPATTAIACVSALVESALWTKPRPAWTATALYSAIAVLATSVLVGLCLIIGGLPGGLI